MEWNTNLSQSDFDAFTEKHPYCHYMKTSMWAGLKEKEGWTAFYTGLTEKKNIKAAALVLKKKWFGMNYLYIPWGMTVEYEDKECLVRMIQELKAFAKTQKAIFLKTDPNVLRMERNITGEEIPGGIHHEEVTELLKEEGFLHFGYRYGYSGTWVNRYTLVIDLSPSLDEITANFTKSRQNVLKRQQLMHITTRLGTQDDIPYLCQFEKELVEIQGFAPKKPSYFKDIMKQYQEHCCLYVTEIDLNGMIEGLNSEIHSKKYAKDKEALAAKEKELKQAEVWQQSYGSQVVLAAGLFLWLGTKSWDLYTYNRKAFNSLKAVDFLHRFAIEDMKNRGVLFYDMCGFSGSTDKKDPYYGLYDYKRSFGSQFYEQLGEFDYVLNPRAYRLFKRMRRQKNRVLRKWRRFRYIKKGA